MEMEVSSSAARSPTIGSVVPTQPAVQRTAASSRAAEIEMRMVFLIMILYRK